MKIFRFWSTFNPPALTPALADLVDIRTPEAMASDAPVVVTGGSRGRTGFGEGIVLGIIMSKAEQPSWGDRLEAVAGEAPIRLPGVDQPKAVFIADAGDSIDLQDWMIARLSAAARGFAEEAATAGLAAGQLRIRVENYERLILEERIDTSAVVLRQAIAADGAYKAVDQDGVALTLDPAIGALHAFDLLFEGSVSQTKGALFVELVGLETGARIAAWTLKPDSERRWQQFWVPYSTIPSLEICQIRVRATQPRSGWSIALGRTDRQPFFTAGLQADAPPIACRIWEGSAVCGSPPSPLALVPDESEAPPRRSGKIRFLASDLMGHATALDPHQQDRLQWRGDLSAFQLHPSGRKPVVACLRGITVTDVETITAEVALAHRDAQDTRFALWATPSEASPDGAPAAPSQPSRWKLAGRSSELASGPAGLRWLTLAGGESGVLNFRFGQRHTGEIDVFFATCNRTEKSDFAWALFKRIIIQ